MFVHGNPETAAIWGPMRAALEAAGISDVVTLSPPGFGAPLPPSWQPTPPNFVDWLVAEVESLDGPIDIVGHDWGAGHVYGLLDIRPDLVRSWSADCAGLLHNDYEWHDMAQLWQSPDGEAAISMMVATPIADMVAGYGSLGLPEPIATSMAGAAGPEMGDCILGLHRGASQPYMRKLGARLGEATLPPGLVINPLDDDYVPAALSKHMGPLLDAVYLPLGGRGHWCMCDDVDAIAAELVSFWSAAG